MSPQQKLYLLAPSFDFPPDGAVRLGNLIADPFRPHRALATLPEDRWPTLTTSSQSDRTIVRETQHDGHISAMAQMLQVVSASIGGESSRRGTTELEMTALYSIFFQTDPDLDHVRQLLDVPAVQSLMRSTFWRRPLFLISGIKIARGFAASQVESRLHVAGAGATAAVASTGISVGLDASQSRNSRAGDSFQAGNDVVLAYKLLVVARKGWRSRELVLDEYRPKAGFLGDEKLATALDKRQDMETTPATVGDLSETDEEAVLVEMPMHDETEEHLTIVFVAAEE